MLVQTSLRHVNKINSEVKLQMQKLYLMPTMALKGIYTFRFAV